MNLLTFFLPSWTPAGVINLLERESVSQYGAGPMSAADPYEPVRKTQENEATVKKGY